MGIIFTLRPESPFLEGNELFQFGCVDVLDELAVLLSPLEHLNLILDDLLLLLFTLSVLFQNLIGEGAFWDRVRLGLRLEGGPVEHPLFGELSFALFQFGEFLLLELFGEENGFDLLEDLLADLLLLDSFLLFEELFLHSFLDEPPLLLHFLPAFLLLLESV